MIPAQPPLPTDWSLPFQPEAGSQTSILISESLVGFNVAVTRQKAGRFLKSAGSGAFGPLKTSSGGLNAPAGTIRADVIVVSGSVKVAILSHDAPKHIAVVNRTRATIFMGVFYS